MDEFSVTEVAQVATAYAIEALRMFDHLHFRTLMKEVLAPQRPRSGTQAAHPQEAVRHQRRASLV